MNATISEEISLLKSSYEITKNEVICRIQLRDRAFYFYLATCATIFGAAFIKIESFNIYLLYFIPPICFGFSNFVSQHNNMIGLLSKFCAIELDKKARTLGVELIQWDGSIMLLSEHEKLLWNRYVSYFNILLFPSIISLFALIFEYLQEGSLGKNLNDFDRSDLVFILGITIGVFSIILSYIMILFSKKHRLVINNSIRDHHRSLCKAQISVSPKCDQTSNCVPI